MTRARRHRSLISGAALVLAATVLVSCGVREDERPRALPADMLPAELSESAPPTTVAQAGTTTQRIYVLETPDGTEEVLAARPLLISGGVNAADFPRQVIDELVRIRPGENENFQNAIPNTTSVLDVRFVAGPDGANDVLEINLNELEGVTGPRLKLAIAQMVFTATSIPGVRGVRFLLNGVPAAVPLDVGESSVGAIVTKGDFPQLNPNRAPATTTTTPPAEPAPIGPAPEPDPPA